VSGDHGGNDDAILREVAKGLKPTRAIFFERVPFEESRVKRVPIVDEFLDIFQGELRCGRGTPQVLEETIGANDIVKRSSISSERLANTLS